ncbi:hypothetical protein Q5752_002242 [Cryptotrichosporon argae]
MSALIAALLFTASAVSASSHAAGMTPIGCIASFDEGQVGGFSTGYTVASCQAACVGVGYLYAVLTESNGLCECGLDSKILTGASAYQASVSAADFASGACGGTGYSFSIETTWSPGPNGACVTTPEFVSGSLDAYAESLDTIEDCFQMCEPSTSLYYRPMSAGGFDCACWTTGTADVSTTAADTCTSTGYYQFEHYAGDYVSQTDDSGSPAAPSTWAKRQVSNQQALRARVARAQVCPAPATACSVAGDADSFECLNTRYELESCGGCMSGTWNDAAAPGGVDCTSLPGVAWGAVTCLAGRCVAFSCSNGFALSANGTCVGV